MRFQHGGADARGPAGAARGGVAGLGVCRAALAPAGSSSSLLLPSLELSDTHSL